MFFNHIYDMYDIYLARIFSELNTILRLTIRSAFSALSETSLLKLLFFHGKEKLNKVQPKTGYRPQHISPSANNVLRGGLSCISSFFLSQHVFFD